MFGFSKKQKEIEFITKQQIDEIVASLTDFMVKSELPLVDFSEGDTLRWKVTKDTYKPSWDILKEINDLKCENGQRKRENKELKDEINVLNSNNDFLRNEIKKINEQCVRYDENFKRIKDEFYVPDYLVTTGEATGHQNILKSEAVSFDKLNSGAFKMIVNGELSFGGIDTHHTSKENYENHKSLIDKWKKEINNNKPKK